MTLAQRQTNKRIKDAYIVAQKRLLKQLEWVYSKYSVDGILNYTGMMKYNRLNNLNKELKKVIKELESTVSSEVKSLQKLELLKGYNDIVKLVPDRSFSMLSKAAIKSAVNNPLKIIALNSLGSDMNFKLQRAVIQNFITGESYFKLVNPGSP